MNAAPMSGSATAKATISIFQYLVHFRNQLHHIVLRIYSHCISLTRVLKRLEVDSRNAEPGSLFQIQFKKIRTKLLIFFIIVLLCSIS